MDFYLLPIIQKWFYFLHRYLSKYPTEFRGLILLIQSSVLLILIDDVYIHENIFLHEEDVKCYDCCFGIYGNGEKTSASGY